VRHILHAVIFAAVIALGTTCVDAQSPAPIRVANYPSKPVRVIVGLAPGGATDVQARSFSQKLSEQTARTFVVDNRSGAGGLIALARYVKAPEMAEKLAEDGGEPAGSSASQFGQFIAAQTVRWRNLIKENGVQVAH